MELSFREYGDPGRPTIVTLHGLLGSSRNWQAAGQALASAFRVFCVDLPNHGDSPWTDEMSYDSMAGGLLTWMRERGIERPILMGHSMGGKLAMKIACEHPDQISKLVVVDIVPKLYPKSHDGEFEGMRALELSRLGSRGEAEKGLEPFVSDWGMRKFLATNLKRSDGGSGFEWMVNLDAIEAAVPELEKSPLGAEDRYEGSVLFVMGGKSRYFAKEDVPLLRRHFPTSALEVIAESGHNPHFEARGRFVEIVSAFANGS